MPTFVINETRSKIKTPLKSLSSRFIAGTLISPTRPSNISSLPSHDSVAACVTPSIEYNQNSLHSPPSPIPTMTPNTAHQKKSTQSPLRDDRKTKKGSSSTIERTVDLTDVLLISPSLLHPPILAWSACLPFSHNRRSRVSSFVASPRVYPDGFEQANFRFANPSSGALVPSLQYSLCIALML
jgi:hypothetical protein